MNQLNKALTDKGSIEYFISDDGIVMAMEAGVAVPVHPDRNRYYNLILNILIEHPVYSKMRSRYENDVQFVFQFIHWYLSGFNQCADVVDGRLTDLDGEKHTLINHVEVTPREREIIELMGDGKADKQIADILGISINTVLTIIARMREKMCATSKYHIVSMAAKAGII